MEQVLCPERPERKLTVYRRTLVICLTLLAAILASYGQVRHFDFVNMDDPAYVVENQMVRSGLNGDSIRQAMTTTEAAYWIPLTWLSLMVDTEIYGPRPGGYHITNLLLHAASALLLFVLLFRFTGAVWPSALAAGLFAVHPIHVESVAWISERKDVLSLFWGFLAIGCYGRYARRRSRAAFGAALGCLLLGLMAKPILVTWPFLFLLLDYWPLRRWALADAGRRFPARRVGELLVEKTPFFVLAGFFCWTTLMAQGGGGAVLQMAALPMAYRLANAAISYIWYIGKMLWPTGLNVYYTHPGILVSIPAAVGGALLIAGLSYGAIRVATRYPFVPVGWFWFLGTMVPVIGLVQAGLQARADRFGYIPMIGLYIIIAWMAAEFARRQKWNRHWLSVAAIAVLLILGARTHMQVGFWKDSESLFRRALYVDSENDVAHNNLGAALWAKGNHRNAGEHYQRAAEINPRNHQAWNNLGVWEAETGKLEKAKHAYETAISLNPNVALYRYNFGKLLFATGEPDAAIAEFAEALRLHPGYADVYNLMGTIIEGRGRVDKAEVFYRKAVEADPDYTEARKNLDRIQENRP